MRRGTLLSCALCALSVACGDDASGGAGALAELAPKSGNASLTGSASFREEAGAVTLTLALSGAPPGEHAVHIHETGDCSADDAMSAGGHWNPDAHAHGAPADESHLGDLGNVSIDSKGDGAVTLSKSEWKIGDGSDHDLVGKAVIVHAMPDDFTTQPTGNAGGRIGCGVIE